MGRAETVVMPVCLGLALTDETAFQDPRDFLDLVIASGFSIFKTFLPARPTGSLNLCRLQRDLPCLHHLSGALYLWSLGWQPLLAPAPVADRPVRGSPERPDPGLVR